MQGIIVMPLVIRLAGLSVYGASVVWPSALAFIFAFSYFGVGYSYRRKLASAIDVSERRILFEPQFTYQLIILSLVCIVALLIGLAGPLSDGTNETYAWVLVGWLAVHFLFFQTQEYFRNTLRFDYFNLINIFSNVLFVASIVAWGLLGRTITLTALLLLATATKAIVTLPWLILLLRELGLPRLYLPVHALMEDIRVGWPIFLDFISYNMLNFGDRYLITIFLSVTEVGHYQPGYQLAYLLIFIPRCGDMLLPPILARLMDAGDRLSAERVASDFLHFFLMIAAPFAMGALLVGPSIIALLADPQTAYISRWVTAMVVLGTALYGFTLFCYQAAYVLGRMRIVMIANLIGAGLNLSLNIILLIIFRNINVAALACLLSYGATATYIAWALRGDWHFHLDPHRIAGFFGAACLMGAALMAIGFRPLTVSSLPLPYLAIAIIFAVAAYFVTLWLIGGLQLSSITQLEASSRKTIPKNSAQD
jgi:O-antigen/teichoic acid export membrane protein